MMFFLGFLWFDDRVFFGIVDSLLTNDGKLLFFIDIITEVVVVEDVRLDFHIFGSIVLVHFDIF